MPKPETESPFTDEAPEGFTKADTDVDSYPTWEFASGALQGVVQKVKLVEVKRGNELRDVRMAVVLCADETSHLLWESANLKDFFDNLDQGVEIWINRAGEQKLDGARTMKLYDARYRA